ncbi:MAG: hypothetical protein DME88_00870 [Verrucomicrobia bacterium]|jgi:hypothetical protein|nr:MAG: hypothetical protein DME88_00870 [Verrucomicrobiota bacterium]
MKTFIIELIPAQDEPSQSEGVYHVTVDGHPVICLSDSEANAALPFNNSQQRTHLLQTLDAERLVKFREALEGD